MFERYTISSALFAEAGEIEVGIGIPGFERDGLTIVVYRCGECPSFLKANGEVKVGEWVASSDCDGIAKRLFRIGAFVIFQFQMAYVYPGYRKPGIMGKGLAIKAER